jgi:hypothetical protein
MTDNELGIVKAVFTYGWPVVIGVSSYLWKVQNDKIEGVKKAAEEKIQALNDEMVRQRANIAKLFDQDAASQRASEQRMIDLFREMNTLSRK